MALPTYHLDQHSGSTEHENWTEWAGSRQTRKSSRKTFDTTATSATRTTNLPTEIPHQAVNSATLFGRRPLTAVARVQIPYGVPTKPLLTRGLCRYRHDRTALS